MGYRNLFFIMIFLVPMVIGPMVYAEGKGKTKQILLHLGPVIEEEPPADLSGEEEPRRRSFRDKPPSRHSVQVTKKSLREASRPKQRNPQLSSQKLVIIALDAQGNEIDRRLVPDPRLIRTEGW